jgi:5-formyltetrahydrofolate cyclo-ligase
LVNHNAHITAQKKNLRQHLRAVRHGLPPSQRTAETHATVQALWPLIEHCDALASYCALADELDLDTIHHRWWELGRQLWLPRVSAPGTLTWHALDRPGPTIVGSYGIREPDPTRVPATPLPADATVLVPGVGFTRDGHRLGQGQGFYDRVLADHRGHTIGIAFRCQILDTLPHEPHDQPVAALIASGERLR